MPRRTTSLRTSLLALAVAALTLTWSPRSEAQAPDRQVLIEQGKASRLAGDEAGALAAFERAHQMAPTPETFGLMGASEYNLNRMVEAEVHLTEALRWKDDAWVKRNRPKLMDILQTVKSQLGWIEVVGTPSGAEVEVAGRAVGRLPLPGRIRVVAGEVNVRLAAVGYRVSRRDVDVDYDQVTRVNIDLSRAAVTDPVDRAPVPRAGTPNPGRRRGPEAPSLEEVEPPPSRSAGNYRTAGWVVAGAGVMLASAGLAALIVRESNTREFNDHKNPTCAQSLPNKGGGPCPTYLDRMNTAKTIAIITFSGAALAGAVSAVLLSAGGSSESAAARTGTAIAKIPCMPTLERPGAACTFAF